MKIAKILQDPVIDQGSDYSTPPVRRDEYVIVAGAGNDTMTKG